MSYTIDTKLTTPVAINAKDLNAFILKKKGADCPLANLGDTIITIGWMYSIDPLYILAHAIWESGWGTSQIAQKKFNLFGWGAFDDDPMNKAKTFRNFDHCILFVMSRIKIKYFDEGKDTLFLMGKDYASDIGWANGICSIMQGIDNFLKTK
jgi:beta-N-acetylglucosaminidase